MPTAPIIRALLPLGIVLPFHLWAAGDCAGPTRLCQRLEPNMFVFIGKPAEYSRERHGVVTVTFEIQELLWGPAGQRSIQVLLDDGYGKRSGEPEFFAVRPLQDGLYLENNCVGLNLPAADPFVGEFRRAVAARQAASLSVKALARWSVPVSGTAVHLSGNAQTLRATMNDDAAWLIPALPPGKYTVRATRANFRQKEPGVEVSIPPMSCGDLRIVMESDSEVTGRIVDARGEPIRNATFHLAGQVSSLSAIGRGLAFLRDSISRMLGWMRNDELNQTAFSHARTDSDGRFAYSDVYPGWYLLSADISEVNNNFGIPLPNVFYPGVYGWKSAKHLVVEEGKSLHDVLFRLPDFGPKRRVVISVRSEDDVPVAGAIVQDSGLNPANPMATNSGVHQSTDQAGQVTLDLWPVSAYRLTATLWLNGNSWSGAPVEIAPGQASFQSRIVLKGLLLRRGGNRLSKP